MYIHACTHVSYHMYMMICTCTCTNIMICTVHIKKTCEFCVIGVVFALNSKRSGVKPQCFFSGLEIILINISIINCQCIFCQFQAHDTRPLYTRVCALHYIENICALPFNCAWFSCELASFFKLVLYM